MAGCKGTFTWQLVAKAEVPGRRNVGRIPHPEIVSLDSNPCYNVNQCAPVAQLDRAMGFYPTGRGFESLRVYQ